MPEHTIISDTNLLLDFIEDSKANLTDEKYKTTLEALGRLRTPRVSLRSCPLHRSGFRPVITPRLNLPFKIEKMTIYTTSPLDYPPADAEIISNIEEDEASGLQVVFYSTEKLA